MFRVLTLSFLILFLAACHESGGGGSGGKKGGGGKDGKGKGANGKQNNGKGGQGKGGQNKNEPQKKNEGGAGTGATPTSTPSAARAAGKLDDTFKGVAYNPEATLRSSAGDVRPVSTIPRVVEPGEEYRRVSLRSDAEYDQGTTIPVSYTPDYADSTH